MLISCPECEKQISDRAASCPNCGFPIAEHLESEKEEKAREADRASRQHVGEVDCAVCEARGFRMKDVEREDGTVRQVFDWCPICEHSGRVPLCQSSSGYFAVSYRRLEDFLAGAIDEDSEDVHAFGDDRPTEHRYPKAGPRKPQRADGSQGVVVEACDLEPGDESPDS
jgi:hypothetical protein